MKMNVSLRRLLRGPEGGYYAFALGFLLLTLLPLGVGRLYSIFYLNFGSQLLILGLFALSLDLIMGYTGLVSLGHAMFFGLGAYAAALVLLKVAPSLALALLTPMAAGALVAWIVGYFSIRIKGVYFAMLTLAFSGMFYEFIYRWEAVGGSDGLPDIPEPTLGLGSWGVSLGEPVAFFYFTWAVVLLVYLLAVRLVSSPIGAVLQGIRENEERVEFLGYDVKGYRQLAFLLSGVVGGLSGGLFAVYQNFVDPSLLHWLRSGEVLVMVLLGGMGTLYGPILGAMAFLLLKDVLSSYTEHWRLVLGLIFIGFVLFSPQGFVGLFRGVRDRLLRRMRMPRPQGSHPRPQSEVEAVHPAPAEPALEEGAPQAQADRG